MKGVKTVIMAATMCALLIYHCESPSAGLDSTARWTKVKTFFPRDVALREVTNDDSIKTLKAEIESRTNGILDILVNNAGRNYTVPALDVEIAEIRETFETNLFGVMRMCQASMDFRAKKLILWCT